MKESTLAANENGSLTVSRGETAHLSRTRVSLLADVAALTVIGIAMLRQLHPMGDTYLSPDEAFDVAIAGAPSIGDVYVASRATPHPPLFFLLMHLWMNLGRSEFVLRLLPWILGGASLWFLYRWSGRVFGKPAGLMTLLFAAFSPVFLPVSVEIRAYSLLFLLSTAAIWQFDRAVGKGSPFGIAIYFLLTFLAILAHYAAVFVIVSLALYAVLRFRAGRPPAKLLSIWIGGQIGVACLYAFLYVTQAKILRGSSQEREAMTGWLSQGYFRQASGGIVSFLVRQSREVFEYFFRSPLLAILGLLTTLVGLAVLAFRRRPQTVLLAAPLLLAPIAGLLDLYPFAGTRHCLFMLPFVLSAMGVTVSALLRDRLGIALPMAVLLAPILYATVPRSPGNLFQMNAALEKLRERAPTGSYVLTDFETGNVLHYYLRRRSFPKYVVVRSPLWAPQPAVFADEIARMVRVQRLSAGRRFWVVQVSADPGGSQAVLKRFSSAAAIADWRFGDISILEVQL